MAGVTRRPAISILLVFTSVIFVLSHARSNSTPVTSTAPAASSQPSILSNLFNPNSLMGASPHTRSAPPSTTHGFSDQSKYVKLSASGAVVAVADFNYDRFIDLLMIDTSKMRSLSVMLWDHDKFIFRHSGTPISLDHPTLKAVEEKAGVNSMGRIVATYVADFGNDGILDVLVSDGTQGRIFFGDGDGSFNASTPIIVPELPRVAALVDANADFVPDIFVIFANQTRGFWQYSRNNMTDEARFNQEGHLVFQNWTGGSNHNVDGKPCTTDDEMASAIAFADLDGDCLPDLIVPTTCGLEVWSNDAAANRPFWQLSAARPSTDMRQLGVEVYNFAHGDRVIAIADFNSDGTNDIAVVNRNRHDMLVHLNVQKGREVGDLCAPDGDWKLERRVGMSSAVNLRKPRLGSMFGAVEIPPTMHVGDYDLDGMPDILVIDGTSTQPIIFRNKGTWSQRRMEDANFERLERAVESGLSKGNSQAISATFFDTDEIGRQDILVVRSGNETRLMWNTVHEGWDSLFFKGTMLSALGYRLDPRPFAPVVGNTIKISYMERGTRRRVRRICSQCAQSGALQLGTCNCQYGLHGIANYIEELFVGAGASSRSWSSLMPNSMAVIWAEGGNNTGSWWMEYFTQRRGSQMIRVTAILMACLVALGFSILWLQNQEAKEDRERYDRESTRLFSFVV